MADNCDDLIARLRDADNRPLAGRMLLRKHDASGKLVLVDADDPDSAPIVIDENFLKRLAAAGSNEEAWGLVSRQLAQLVEEINTKLARLLRDLPKS